MSIVELPEARQHAHLPSLLGGSLLVTGLVGTFLAGTLSNPYATAFPWAVVVGSSLFLFFQRSQWMPTESLQNAQFTPRHIAVPYFLALAVALLVYHTMGLETTLLVNGLLLVCYLLVALNAWFYPGRWFVLPMLIGTALFHRLLALYSSPLLMGNDTFFHNRMGEAVATAGSLEPLTASKYFYAPLYHLFNAVSRGLLELPGREVASLTTVVLATVVPACAIYWLADSYWDRRVAAFAALLYVCGDFAIGWAIQPQVTSVSIGLFALSFCALVTYIRSQSKRSLLVAFGTLLLVAFTHQVATFITMFAVVVFLGLRQLYERKDALRPARISLIYILVVVLNFQWTRWGGPTAETEDFFSVMVNQVFASTLSAAEESTTRVAYTLPADPNIHPASSNALSLVHVAGSAALVGASVAGVLLWLWVRTDRSDRASGFAVGGLVGLMFAVVLAGPIAGIRTILPWRWFAYIYVPAALLAAVVLVLTVRRGVSVLPGRENLIAMGLLLLLVGPYITVMGGNFIGSAHDPVFDDSPRAQRFGLETTEKAMLDHSLTYVPETDTVVTDRVIATILWRNYDRPNTEVATIDYGDPDSLAGTAENAVLFNRAYLGSDNARYDLLLNGTTVSVYGPVPVEEVDPNRRAVIYDSGSDELVQLRPGTAAETNDTVAALAPARA